MTYRDRAIQCSLCGAELTRDDAREYWRCVKCKGALIAVVDVVRELVAVAPDLVPDEGVGGLPTLGRRSRTPLVACAMCGAPMEPVFLGGVPVDRCYHDDLIWFDRGELQQVLAAAREQRDERQASWLSRLLGV